MTLGEVDYGLIGVVGGLVGFMAFFNGLMATSVSRFYAFAVGQAHAATDTDAALDECRRWFNAAVTIHTVIPILSLVIGYPIGEWAVRHFLTIPPDRVEACVWVFRITCLTCLVSMTAVPYHAMYTAKQEIAELTIYGFVTTTLNVIFLCYMVTHQADWFVRYVGWTAFLSVAPSLIITMRSFVKYQECRIVPEYFWDWKRIKSLVVYAGCRLLTSIATMCSFQGMTILVNKMLGPARNAAMAVGNNVASHTLSLSNALSSAMTPAITNATGAGDLARVERLAYRANICSSLSVVVFALPLCLEIDKILDLWLKAPPAQTASLCVLMLLARYIDQLTVGQCLCVSALQNIGRFQAVGAVVCCIPLLIAFVYFSFGGDLSGVGWGFVMMYLVGDVQKLYFAKKMCNMSVTSWVQGVLVPMSVVVVLSMLVGVIVKTSMSPSLVRVFCTTAAVESVLLLSSWKWLLAEDERNRISAKVSGVILMLRGVQKS